MCLQHKSLKTLRKRRNCLFSTLSENFLPFSLNLKLSSANSYTLDGSKICCLGKGYFFVVCWLPAMSPFPTIFYKGFSLTGFKCHDCVNPFPNKPWFLRVCITSLLKTLLEKEKLLVKSNFLLFHQCFVQGSKTFCHFHQI